MIPPLLRVTRRIAIASLATVIVVLLASPTYRPVFLGGPGLAQGALIAAIALGIVVTYRGSGVVNLSNGAIGMYAAYVYAELRSKGNLFLPPLPNPLAPVEGIVHRFSPSRSFDLPDIPTSVSFGGPMTFWPALAITLLVCVLLGLALHRLVFRPLRGAPPLGTVVASVGVLVLLQAVVLRRFSVSPHTVKSIPFVNKTRVNLGFTALTQEQAFVVLLVCALSVALWLLYQRTSFGMATRAAAENERAAVTLGLSPDILAAANLVISAVVTGLLGVFVASINSNVDPLVLPALVVPAVCAALVGGFESFAVTVGASFLLGMHVPVIQTLGIREPWFPHAGMFPVPGVETVIPLFVIGLVLFLRGEALPGRGTTDTSPLPESPTPGRTSILVAAPAAIAVTAVATIVFLSPDYRAALSNSMIGVVACLSVVVITGYVGQLSLAPMAFAGIGAFLVSALSHGLGWPFPIPLLVATTCAGIVGLFVALPSLRIRGTSLAIVTLAFGVSCERFVFSNSDVNGGLDGAPVPTPRLIDQSRAVSGRFLGVSLGDGHQPNPLTTLFCLALASLVALLVANIRRSNTGRQMLAVRSNERAAAAAGINVAGTKALAFVISATIAGVAGSLIAYRSGGANQERFTYMEGLLLFAFAYLGGISRISGAVAGGALVSGGIVLTFAQRTLGVPEEFGLLLGGVGLVLAAAGNPEGIAASLSRQLASFGPRILGRPRVRGGSE